MDNIVFKKNNSLKCGSEIKVLSIISLICTILSCISYFFYYDFDYINGEWVDFGLTFTFLDMFDLISLLLTITPIILLVLYIFMFHSKLKATVLVPIIFGIFGLNSIFNLLFGYRYSSLLFGYRYSRYVVPYGIYRILALVILVCSVLAVKSALKGFNKKIFIIIAMAVCLLYEALSIIGFFSIMYYYIEESEYLYLFTSPMSIIGSITLYVALLLFALKNKIPSVLALSPEKERARAEKMNPEQALKLLKYKLDLGMITEEEYQAQRAEIISKL